MGHSRPSQPSPQKPSPARTGVVRRSGPGLWEALVDSEGARKAAEVFSLMERYLWIRPKEGTPRLLEFNAIQMILAFNVALAWHLKIPIRFLVPKYRQGGVTTWCFALLFALCLRATALGKAYRVGLVSHEEDGGEKVFQIIRTFVKNLPPALSNTANPQFKTDHYNSVQITWSFGAELHVHSVKKLDALGRGGTVNALHCTEAGSYGDKGVNASEAMSAIKGSLVKEEDTLPDSMVIYESTAKGHDSFFWPLVEDSLKGKSDYVTLFLPWFLEPAYTMTWEAYRAQVRSNPVNPDPGPHFIPTHEEQALREQLRAPVPESDWHFRYSAELTDGQLIWRRSTIKELGGDVKSFRREYPSTIEEAFAATEQGRFTADQVAHYQSLVHEPLEHGDIRMPGANKVTTWEAHPHGAWAVWDRAPIPGDSYTVVADVSEGQGQDNSHAIVLHDNSMRVVARYTSGQAQWEDVALVLEAAGYHWNRALVAVEANVSKTFMAGRLVAEALFKAGYSNLYFYREEDQLNPSAPSKPGWLTTEATRAKAISQMSEACRSRRLVSHDEILVREMRSFVWNEKKKRYEAAPGKTDDAVMTTAIACALLAPDGIKKHVGAVVPLNDPVANAIKHYEQLAKSQPGSDQGLSFF